MVSQLTEGHVAWTMPASLWPLNGDPSAFQNRRRFQTPTILRFATDSFMDEFLNLLNTQPERLNEFVAAPETWSSPPNEPPAPPPQKTGLALKLSRAREAAVRRLEARGSLVIGQSRSSSPHKVLKLFQAVHQRFYLVTACLVCRMPGLPDRRIDAGAQERATFVLRLLQPHSNADRFAPDPRDCDEFALVNGAWQPVAEPDSFVTGEEQHPLSPAAYTEDDQRRRRLLVGLIPVGDRERLLQATQPNPAGELPPPQLIDARQMLLRTQVIGPLHNLKDLVEVNSAAAAEPVPTNVTPKQQSQSDTNKQAILDRTENQLQQISWYLLLDLANFLETNLNELWQVIQSNGSGAGLSTPELQTLWNTLSQATYTPTGMKLAAALSSAHAAKDLLEGATSTYRGDKTGWPNFDFRFYTTTTANFQALQPALNPDTLEGQIMQAIKSLPTTNPHPPLPVSVIAQANANPQRPVWFAVRCVLERPNCSPFIAPLVSEPTVAFQLAAYFDPDAPARPIRIGLPIDTTPAGLRKFDKNTAFVMSDILQCQVSKASKAAGGLSFVDLVLSVLPFPFKQDLGGKGGSEFPCADSGGLICSFSIPIITICALILLIIFVKLLDIIFFWMPFFQICLPLPGLKAKEG